MFVKTVVEQYLHKRWNTVQIRHRDVFACDECGTTYTLGHKAVHANAGSLTFCSRVCNKKARSTGCLAQQWKQTKLERYGVEYSSQVTGAGQKMIATRMERTGASAPSVQSSTSNAQFVQTMLHRHGADHPSRVGAIKDKKRRTYRERYGVDNPFSNGSPFRLDSLELSVAGQKGYRSTARQENGWIISTPERLLVEHLRMRYGDVQQQVPVEHGTRKPWLIDAYVSSIKTYVQLDGVFWHGLDKPYEELHQLGKKAYDADRLQDEWFRAHGSRLVRVTDKELMACYRSQNWSDIAVKLGG